MAKRVQLKADDYLDDGYGDEDYYGEQDDEYEQALKESKKQKKQASKAKKKTANAVSQEDIDELNALFQGFFTEEQIRGTLENYKTQADGKDQAKAQLVYRKAELDKKGQQNKKVVIKAKVADAAAQAIIEEEKKAVDVFEKKRAKQLGKKEEEKNEVIIVDAATLNAPYPEVTYEINGQPIEASEEEKSNLNLVIIGHVDSGKSTLSGQILLKNGLVTKQQLRANERKAEMNNKVGFELAYVMDETEEEQERGVTIELTTRYFATPNRNFTILDAPGHMDFIANMITGAAQANCAMLVIDSKQQAFERGWDGDRATCKEHAILARSLGVTQIVVAVNKLESVDFSQERYDDIVEILKGYLKKCGFKIQDTYFVPISALSDENVSRKATDPALTSWYGADQPCLIEVLDQLRLPARSYTRPLRVTVSDFMQKATGPLIGDCIAAKVESGVIIERKELLLMPQNVMVTVKGITLKDETVQYAVGGAIIEVGLRLPSDFDVNYLRRGNVLCDPQHPIKYVQVFNARLVICDLGDKGAICRGEPVVVHCYSTKGPGKLQKFCSQIDPTTGEVIKKSPKFLRSGMFVKVQIKLHERQCLELYSTMKNIGRVVIRQGQRSIGAGTILEFLS